MYARRHVFFKKKLNWGKRHIIHLIILQKRPVYKPSSHEPVARPDLILHFFFLQLFLYVF